MLRLRIEDILIEKGFKLNGTMPNLDILEEQGKSKYWLNKQLGMHYVSFKKMIENNTTSIKFDTLERLSKILEVPVGDLFEQYEDEI